MSSSCLLQRDRLSSVNYGSVAATDYGSVATTDLPDVAVGHQVYAGGATQPLYGATESNANLTQRNKFLRHDDVITDEQLRIDVSGKQPLLSNSDSNRTPSPVAFDDVIADVTFADDVSKLEDDVIVQEEKGGFRKTFGDVTRRQWTSLFAVCYVNFASNASLSILSSFFSQEALDHGATQFQIGLIFGCYAIINALSCPVLGYLLPVFGAKTMLLVGMTTSGLCSFAFSQVFRFTAPGLFVGGCFVVRALQALGCASYYIGSTVVLAREWNQSLTFAMGLAEIFTGIGMIAGPLIGGWLYEQGGFELPFVVIGVVMIFGLFVAHFAVKTTCSSSTPGNFLALIRIPNVAATAIFMCFMWSAMDFNMPQLQLHMRQLAVSPVVVGSMFMILALGYTVLAPFVGVFARTRKAERTTMIVGSLLVVASYLLVGPAPFFHVFGLDRPSIATISVSMALLGVGLGAALVPTFSDLSHSAVEGGMPDDITTAGLVGGLFNGVTFFGEFIGPTIGGALMQQGGDFPNVSFIFAIVLAVVVFATAVFYLVNARREIPGSVKRKRTRTVSSRYASVSVCDPNFT